MEQTITVGKWCRQYLAEREQEWSVVTQINYRYLLEQYIIPAIGEIELASLANRAIQKFYETLSIHGLGAQSILCVHLLLRRFLDEACREGLILTNPAKNCKLPQHEEERHAPLLRDEYTRHPDSEEVFLNPKTGQPYQPHEFYYLHQKLLKLACLPQISFRELAKSCKGVAL